MGYDFNYRVTKMAIGCLAMLLAGHLAVTSVRTGWSRMETDFPNDYTAAILTLRGEPLQKYYEWVWFQRQMHYVGIDHQLGG